MKSFILISYFVTLILASFIFSLFSINLRLKKKSAGKIQAQWSTIFNLSTPLSWFLKIFISSYFLWCVYQIVVDPKASDGHHRLMFLIILLSFTPLGNVYIGSVGIILHIRFISWKNVDEKEIILKRKRRYLQIIGLLSPSSSKTKIKRIPLPKKIININ